MEENRETRLAGHSLLFDPTSASYRYWQEVTRDTIAKVKNLITESGCTRRETAALLLAHQLQTEIAGESDFGVSDVEIYRRLVCAALDNVDWWMLAVALLDAHDLRRTVHRRILAQTA